MKKKKYRNRKLPIQKGSEYEELTEHLQILLSDRGIETFKKARKLILEERLECQEILEALKHFLSYKQAGFLIRPTLISLGCEAVGGNTEAVADIAAPLVLMSGGMDIHDDIIDESKTQNSSLTVFGKYGMDVALLSGDALLFKGLMSWRRLIEVLTIEKFIKINEILKGAFFELGDGQALELNWKRKLCVEPKRYLHVIEKKAADIEALLRIGALIGGGSKDEIDALGRYGRRLGMLWILADDIVDMFDHKEIAKRINNGFLPLPIIYVLADSKNKARFYAYLLKKKITKKDVETLLQIVKKTTGIEQTKKIMHALASEALKTVQEFKNNEQLQLLINHSVKLINEIESMQRTSLKCRA
jgi:geranylgeranyl pyrophosphate synthase